MLLLVLLSAVFALSPDDPVVCSDDGAREDCALTARRIENAIAIDGALTEADWQHAAIATGFRQFDPVEGAAPSQKTEVRILYGASGLYVGAHLFDTDPDAIMATLGRRDFFNQADWFVVSIDSHFDRKTAYTFAVNAAGIQLDGVQTNDLDTSWDAVWTSAARVTADGWVVEMRIPYAMLRFPETQDQTWGINFRRIIPRTSETVEWALVRRTERGSGLVSQYGLLKGLSNIRPRRNVQILPYSVSRTQTDEGDDGGLRGTQTVDVGADVKIGLSSNVTLDATVNPDFGQVDADPAVLNLSAFETFFPERRPFFTEGLQIFDFGFGHEGSLLYTRRIGGRAPIITASKVSGRLENGLSVGVLGAVTGDDFNPANYYGVTRLMQEIGTHSSFGGILTATQQSTDAGIDVRSLTGGADWDLRFGDNTYRAGGFFAVSHRDVRLGDPGLGRNTGFAFQPSFGKIRGDWTFSGTLLVTDDQFDTNDLGRLRRNDVVRYSFDADYQINGGQPFGTFRQGSVSLSSWRLHSYAEHLDMGMGFVLRSRVETRGFQSVSGSIFTDYIAGGYDLYETRGLDPYPLPRQVRFNLEYETDSRRSWRLNPETGYEMKSDGSRQASVELGGEWNAGTRLNLRASTSYEMTNGALAWSANETLVRQHDGWAIGAEATSPDALGPDDLLPFDDAGMLDHILAPVTPYAPDAYYVPVFGYRDTRTLDLTLRGNVTFTPTLSLQIYTQLFAAKGRYQDFQILQDRDHLAPFDAYPKRDAFAFSSFNTNVVLRWEYRPGSTLFVVWSQARNGRYAIDPFDTAARSPFARNTLGRFGDTFGVFPTNVFLVKLNYLFIR